MLLECWLRAGPHLPIARCWCKLFCLVLQLDKTVCLGYARPWERLQVQSYRQLSQLQSKDNVLDSPRTRHSLLEVLHVDALCHHRLEKRDLAYRMLKPFHEIGWIIITKEATRSLEP